jgi:seryl-tRNA synthetase
MIAQIKILSNAKEIEEAQKLLQKIANENAEIEKNNAQLSKAKRATLATMLGVPDYKHEPTDLCLIDSEIKLAFANKHNETISINYAGKDFTLIYTDLVWNQIKQLPQFNN